MVKCVVLMLMLAITYALVEVAAMTMVVLLQIPTASTSTVSNVLRQLTVHHHKYVLIILARDVKYVQVNAVKAMCVVTLIQ
jgi:hypothetical protein